MPVQGRAPGVMLRPTPVVRQPVPRPAAPASSVFSSHLGSTPFAGAQARAQQKVTQAIRRGPAQPVPDIPMLANPTPGQAHAALQLAAQAQRRATGGNPAAVRSYQQEVALDPRLRQFRETVQHYAHAAEGHLLASEGRRGVAGVTTIGQVPQGGVPGLSRAAAVQVGRLLQELHSGSRSVATPRAAPKGAFGGLIPAAISNPITAAIAPKLQEDSRAGLSGLVKNVIDPISGTLGHVPGEAVSLPQQTVLSLLDVGKAGLAGVKGNPKPLEQIGNSIVSQLEHPARELDAHPLNAALLFAGAEGAAGRVAGAVGRTGRLGETLRAAADQVRPDKQLYGGEAVARRFSPDPVRKAIEIASEKAQGRTGTQAHGRELEREVVGGLVKPGRVDVQVDKGEQLRRALRGQATSKESVPKAKIGHEAHGEMVEGTLHPDTLQEDLHASLKRALQAQRTGGQEGGAMVGPDLAQNKAEVARIQSLLANKKFIQTRGVEAYEHSQQFIDHQAPRTRTLVELGALAPEKLRAMLFPYAQHRMGATYFSEADHAAAENAAKGLELHHAERIAAGEAGAHADYTAAREYRMEVSGRGPVDQIKAHEDAIKEVAGLKSQVAHAQAEVDRQSGARDKLVSDQRSRRGKEGGVMSDADRAMKAEREAQLAHANAHLKESQLAYRAARDRQASSTLPATKAGLRYSDGRFLPTQDILDHMAQTGTRVGFLSHDERLMQRGSFFKPTTQRPGLMGKELRTGQSFLHATYDRSHAALVAQAAKEANNIAGHSGYNAILNRFGVGLHDSKADAAEAGKNFSHDAEGQRVEGALGKMVPHLIGPDQVLEKDLVHPAELAPVLKQFGLEQHTNVSAANVGKWTNIPEKVSQRIAEHEGLRASGDAKRVGGWYTQHWRQAQLYLSPRWLFGSPQEHGVRLITAGASPKALLGRSGRFGAKVVDAMDHVGAGTDPEAAQAALEAKAALVRGTIYDSADKLAIVRKSDQAVNSLVGKAGAQLERAGTTGAGKVSLKPWNVWHDFVSKTMTKVEHESRTAALGKAAMRDIHDFNGKWSNAMKMTDQQVQDYVKGRLDPAKVEQLVKETDNMMGAWGHLSPAVRSAYQTWSPFGLWWLTSMRFLRRLPIDAPVKTGIAAAIYNATEPQRVSEGQGVNPTVPGYKAGGLKLNLPIVGDVTAQPTYYTPGGVAIEPGKTAADMVLPQVSSSLAAASGRDPLTLEPLTAPGSTGGKGHETSWLQNIGTALTELGIGITPGARQAEQLIEQGGKPYGTSAYQPWEVKPGTKRPINQVLTKILAPTRFTYNGQTGAAGTGAALSPRVQHRLEAAESHAKSIEETPRIKARVKAAEEEATRHGG